MKDIDRGTVMAAKAGDRKALEALTARMEPLVAKVAWDLVKGSHLDFEDLYQGAMMEVFEALQTYDPEKGSFENWTYSPIRRGAVDARNQGQVGPSIPAKTLQRYKTVLEAADWDLGLAQEMAPDFDLSEDSFRAVHDAVTGTTSPYSFTLPGETAPRFDFEDPADVEGDVVTRVLMEAFLDILTDPLDREIVVLHYGLGGQAPMTDGEISAVVGMSREGVNIRRRKAILTMKEGT